MIRAAKLWLMTALALAIAGLAVQEALAQAPALKPPAAAAEPEPAPAPEQQGQEFYVVSAAMMERVAEVINAQRREIERLRARAAKSNCI